MAFDWQEFLKLAKFLRTYRGREFMEEAGLRTAVGRAYYAAFCPSREYARQNFDYSPGHTPKDHIDVRNCFQRRGDRWVRVATNLDQLRKWRNLCDYEAEIHNNLSVWVQKALRCAEEVLIEVS